MTAVRGRTTLMILGAVLVVAAILGGVNGYRYWDDRQTEQAREEAVAAAGRIVEAVFSYGPDTVDTTLREATADLTSDYRREYLELIDTELVRSVRENPYSVTSTTQAGGVVSADRSHAVVLLFINRLFISEDTPEGSISGSRLRVTLSKENSRWLVASIGTV
ncbi:h domain protein [Nocardia sp. 004]|uniref:h domain protein n=1 Tax=Nocardia sp. 004 TaxID=3385978 RepID=UPI0039A14DE3